MLLHLLTALFGLAVLAAGGEAVVRGALGAAKRLRMSPVMAGLVIVGFGTSAPELVVSVDAIVKHQPDVALGNVLGSNISNVLLILGVCALITPLVITPRLLLRDGLVMTGAMMTYMLLAAGSGISRPDAAVLLVLLAAYLVWAYVDEVKAGSPIGAVHEAEAASVRPVPDSWFKLGAALLGGLALLMAGSRLTLSGAIGAGEMLGIPKAVIGLTLVAVGTSLPEFAVSILAVLRRQYDVAVGNVLGSNIFNTLGILGVSGMIQPFAAGGRAADISQWVMLGSAVLLLALLATGLRLNRIEGAGLVLCYAVYTATLFIPVTG